YRVKMELARGIEPPTCGLQNRNRGVAQVVDDMGNPFVIPGDWCTQLSVLFVSLCRTSCQFVACSNTVITPENGTPPGGTPKKSALKVGVGRYLSITNFLLGPFRHAGVGIRVCGDRVP